MRKRTRILWMIVGIILLFLLIAGLIYARISGTH